MAQGRLWGALGQPVEELRRQDVRLVVARANGPLREAITRQPFGRDTTFYPSVRAAVEAFQAAGPAITLYPETRVHEPGSTVD